MRQVLVLIASGGCAAFAAAARKFKRKSGYSSLYSAGERRAISRCSSRSLRRTFSRCDLDFVCGRCKMSVDTAETVDYDQEEQLQKAVEEEFTPGLKKAAVTTSMDAESVREAYNDVRADNTETQWAVFTYDGPRIVCSARGVSFDDFRDHFSEDGRAFGFIRLQTGDEMSKRQKFLLLTWVGPLVSVLQRARMSTDKSIIKSVISNFAVEIQLETMQEFELSHFVDILNKASGANYGTGVREI